MLTWALVLATYNRCDILQSCVLLAVQQSRPPAHVVVVDASDDWESSKRVIEQVLAEHPHIDLTYVPADERSVTVQRNQGLALIDADVVFMLDDDSLMHPGCAAKIMDVYEHDLEGAVAGVQAGVSLTPPDSVAIQTPSKVTGALKTRPGRIGLLQRWLLKHVLLLNLEIGFIPYDGGYPDLPVPREVATHGVRQSRLFSGFRMTYRTRFARMEPFDEALRSYSPGEDLDASYRISRHGALVTAPEARLCHYQSASGRIDRRKTEFLAALNQAFFVRRNALDLTAAQRRYYRLMARRLFAEVIKDGGSRRWDFPQVRGVASAVRLSRQVFSIDPDRLADWYVGVQQQILTRRAD